MTLGLPLIACDYSAVPGKTPDAYDDQYCPLSACMPQLDVYLVTHKPLPEKIRVTLDNVVYLDECKNPIDEVYAHGSNDPGLWVYPGERDMNRLRFSAWTSDGRYWDSLNIAIFDLKNCDSEGAPRELIRLYGVPVLKTSPEYIWGTNCHNGCQSFQATVWMD